ncbi:MAG TPA: right-handed parallel beta-helix repeat-containing protein, partial [Nitrospirota bacterium]|nr:right-handed parallel beta-helix repeat-containing protein [Nitrospirota bacterium]
MRLNLLLLAALAGVLLASNAADAGQVTRVNGSIAKKTVWSGTVLVETPLTVTKGASLAVKPGAEVRFSKGAGLVVEGVLKAEGTKARPVVFTSAEKTPAPGDWSGISLSEAGEGTVLKRCVVSYAAAVSVAACSPVIQGCEIKDGVQGIAVARKGRPAVSKNVIKDMSEGGVNCQMGSAPVITGNTIERCAQYGVTSSQDAQPVIKDNVIAGCVSGLALSQGIPP